MGSMTQKDAKRLRKAVKRRRGYAESLRHTATETRAQAQASGNDEDMGFAVRLDALADAELALARDEEAQAKEIEAQRPGFAKALFGDHSSAEMQERARRAMAAISGRMAIDRIHYLLAHLKLERTGDNHVDMREVEKRLGLTEQVNPKGKPRMQLGGRIDLAETTVFGAPRF